MTSILIAEDHKIFNDGLKAMLNEQFNVVNQQFMGSGVIDAILKYKPDIVLLDINLPKVNGLELARHIKVTMPKTKIVFLSMYAEASFVKAAKEINVDGYLLKDSSSFEILKALEKIERGEIFFDSKLDERKPNLHHEDYFVKQFLLSKREVEVIVNIKTGLSTEQIADKMCVSYETIKSHRKNIFLKLGFNKSSELIQFAIENGL